MAFRFEIIIFLAEGNHPYSIEINRFFLGRTFYRLRLVSNLNGREVIICPGKVVRVYLLTDRNFVYKSQQSLKSNAVQIWHPCVSLKG